MENYSYHVARNIRSLRSLENTIQFKRSESPSLSSVFISLLRNQKISARHLVGITPAGEFHTLAEFYLAGYGWIPVDVTTAQVKKYDCFGKIRKEDAVFILSEDVGLTVVTSDPKIEKRVDMMQCGQYWHLIFAFNARDLVMIEQSFNMQCEELPIGCTPPASNKEG